MAADGLKPFGICLDCEGRWTLSSEGASACPSCGSWDTQAIGPQMAEYHDRRKLDQTIWYWHLDQDSPTPEEEEANKAEEEAILARNRTRPSYGWGGVNGLGEASSHEWRDNYYRDKDARVELERSEQ